MNYHKLMALKPTSFGEMTNTVGQRIEFFEHPIHGDESPVVCVCHELQLAAISDFYELADMKAEHGEYEPVFLNGVFQHGTD